MSILKSIESQIKEVLENKGILLEEIHLLRSNRPDLGQYQINDAMKLAKTLHRNPHEIAEEIIKIITPLGLFENMSVAGAGFINLTLKKEILLQAMKSWARDKHHDLDFLEKETIMIDYGGANIAKTLHVGHLRSANLGESLKRLAKHLGKDVIADVHFGDIGRQSGMVIYEIRNRYPTLNYFSTDPKPPFDPLPITAKDLEEIYPVASNKAKENEEIMEEVRAITTALENHHPGYEALWEKIKAISIDDIKQVYKRLNTDFDLWEGESNCYPYITPMIERLEQEGYLIASEGAKVIEVKEDDDKAPMPALVVVKNDGATLYATRELATLESRIKRFSPAEIWYLTDIRQELYFTQVFRAAYKTNIVPKETNLAFYGFGTMNGKDGKPFKTRDGHAASLTSLLNSVKEEILSRMTSSIPTEEKEEIAEKITIAAVKYADILSNRATDYIFDPSKFIEPEGKTGPFLLYSTIRMKSLLKKANVKNNDILEIATIRDSLDEEVMLLLLEKAKMLTKAYENKELNSIAEYLYQLNNAYNRFYEKHYILTEEDAKQKESWLALTKLVYETNVEILTILGIEIPEKM